MKQVQTAIAVFSIAYASSTYGACLSDPAEAPACRYPQGDSWCEQHGKGNRFAYRDNCLAARGEAKPDAAGNLNWIRYQDLDKHEKRLVKLDVDNSVDRLAFARVRLNQGTPDQDTDSLVIYDYNSTSCGSGGCGLTIFSRTASGKMREVLSISSGAGMDEDGTLLSGFSLGNSYRNGMLNLRINEQVTWVWDGQRYVVK